MAEFKRLRFRTLSFLLALATLSAALAQAETPPATASDLLVISPQQIALAQTSAWEMLSKATNSKKASERRDAIAAFSLVANDQAISIIEDALQDKDPDVRVQAIGCILQMNSEGSVPKLKPLLADKSPDVAFAAARALSQLGDPSGRDLLIEVLTGERKVADGAIDSGVNWAKQVGATNWIFLGASQTASLLIGPYASIGVVAARQFVGDRSAPGRVSSAQSLGPDGSDRAIEILEKALKDRNWTVRAAAAQSLGNASSPQPISQLTSLLTDKKREVRFVAAASIIRLSFLTQQPKPPLASASR